ncbi:MAG: ribosome recycling factor [Acidimicrobiia bacterium]
MIDDALADCKDKMHKAIEHVRDEFVAVRTGRANPAVVEKLTAEYYGTPTPIQQLAGISVPEPRVMVISPYDQGALKPIEKAIQNSDLGVNPSNDGKIIRLVFPELNEERRRELVKVVKQRAEDGRVAVRNIRREAKQKIEKLEKDGEIGKDDLERAEKELEKVTAGFVAEVDKMLERKEAELMEV